MIKRYFPFFIIFSLLTGTLWSQQNETGWLLSLHNLKEKADNGDSAAIFSLARFYETGFDSIQPDFEKAMNLYLLAAQKGFAPARNFIGFRYYNGEGVKKNVDSALYWIRLAAEDGDITAASNLGYLMSQSPDIDHNYTEAIKWLYIAADAKVPSALSQLADLKRQGLGCKPDTMAAITLYEEASDAGDHEAQLKLLAMMGYKWKALSPDSALSLGLKYYSGSAPVAGVDLLELAAESDNPKALALLGDAYSRGIGVTYDHQKSIDYFYKAAKKGDPSAQFIIAELLDFFPDAVSSFSDEKVDGASFWYDKAASIGINDSETAYQRLFKLP